MGLDIRWPIGLMFTLIGVLLTSYGVLKRSASMSLDININLIWGFILLAFGCSMLFFAWRGTKGGADKK